MQRGFRLLLDLVQACSGRRGELQLWIPAIHHFLWGFAGILLLLASEGSVLGVRNEPGTMLSKHHLVSPVLAPLLSHEQPCGWSRV